MSQQNLTNADAVLKEHYPKAIIDAVADKTYVIDQIAKSADHVDATGREATWTAHTKRNKGRRTIVEGGVLPNAGRQGYTKLTATIAYHTYAMEITDAAIEASASNEGAFASLLTEETKGVARDMKQDIARQAYGLGTGVLATVRTTTATGFVIPVDSVQYVEIGDPVDVLKISDGTIAVAGAVVTDVDYTAAANTITLDTTLAATATASTYAVYISGNRNMEMDGLRKIIDDTTTLHGVDRSLSANAVLRSRVVDLASAAAGESSFQQLRDSVNKRGFGEVEEFLTTYGVRRRLASNYVSQKRYNDANATTIRAGYTAIFVDETPVMVDPLLPLGVAFALQKGKLMWHEQTPPGWLQQKDGSIFTLKNGTVAGTHEATWQAYWRWYAVLGCWHAAGLGKLKNCQDDNAESV